MNDSQAALSYGLPLRLMLIWRLVLLQQIRVVAAKRTARRDRSGAPGRALAAARRNAMRKRRHRQFGFQRAAQSPTDHAARERIQNHRQVDELGAQPNVGDVGHPELVDRRRV